jgi:hypothetical protein
MRVIVCGSRGWTDRFAIADRLSELPHQATVVVGYDPDKQVPNGADRFAYEEAPLLELTVENHPAAKYGHPLARNRAMASSGADLCIAFWDGRSTGTAHMMNQARARGIPVEVITQ